MAAEGAAEGLLAPDGAVGSLKPFAGVASSLRARFHHARQRFGGGERRRANDFDLVTVTSENAVYPLSGEYLAKPKVVAAAQEEVRTIAAALCAAATTNSRCLPSPAAPPPSKHTIAHHRKLVSSEHIVCCMRRATAGAGGLNGPVWHPTTRHVAPEQCGQSSTTPRTRARSHSRFTGGAVYGRRRTQRASCWTTC